MSTEFNNFVSSAQVIFEQRLSEATKRILAARVGFRCSNPDCRAPTSGPQEEIDKAVNLGVAAHISAAAPGGPRFDPEINPQQRTDSANGIWLCQNCAKLIDNAPNRYSVTVLQAWKSTAEREADISVGKTATMVTPTAADKWVSTEYIHKAGIARKLESEGYRLRWVDAHHEDERVDLEGWEYVEIEQPGRTLAKLKIKDSPAIGGYLVLLKKKDRS